MLSRRARVCRKLRLSLTRRTASSLQPRSSSSSGLPGAMFISARMLRTATIACFSHSVSANAASSTCAALYSGNGCSMMVSAVIPQMTFTRCQMVSVMNGMIGCARRSRPSSTVTSVWRVPRSSDSEPPVITGLVSSRYQSQNWFQVNSYRMPAAISKRKLSSASRYALTVWLNSARIQRSASDSVISPPLKPQSCSSVFISTKRLAFHSLLQKLR